MYHEDTQRMAIRAVLSRCMALLPDALVVSAYIGAIGGIAPDWTEFSIHSESVKWVGIYSLLVIYILVCT